MIAQQLLKHYQRITAKNSSNGQVQNTFPVVTNRFWSDVQPANLSREEASRWGQTDIAANSKIVFFDPNTNVSLLDRFVDDVGSYYEARGLNPWPTHYEMLLVPVQGQIAPVAVDGVSVSPSTATLAISATQQLTATFTPASPTNQSITWSSSDVAKATVSASGFVTAIASGTATITATTVDGGFSATCTVTVTP